MMSSCATRRPPSRRLASWAASCGLAGSAPRRATSASPDSGRRRTPGLRREEVATLAGVSVDYLVRLEQGRDVHPSADVLVALADAMRMTDDERRHLFLVLGPIGDVVAWNAAWAAVAGGLGLLDVAPPNLVRFVFTHPNARAVFPEWRSIADEQAGRLRRTVSRWSHDATVTDLVDELRRDPEFEVRWNAHPIEAKRRGTKRLAHPEVGDLDLADDTDLQLVTWLPANEVTANRVESLTGTPRLRLVEPG